MAMETVVPDGYEVADGSKNTEQLNKLAPNETTELTVEFAVKSTVEVSQDSRDSQDSQSSPDSEISKISESSSDNSVVNTGNDIFSVVMALVLFSVLVILIVISVKKKKGKGFLSVAVCISVLGVIIAAVPFGTQAADSGNTISITETIIINGDKININFFVKYDLKDDNQQSSENSKNSSDFDETDVVKKSLS